MKLRRPRLGVADIISILAILFGIAIVALYVHEANREYNFVDIKEPVELDQDTYRVGDLVSGFFYGEIYTNNQPVILRRLECKDQRFSLRPVVISSATASRLTGKKVPIVVLDNTSLAVEGAAIEPDTDCYIDICSTYRVQPVFGNVRSLDECYKTDKFSIVAKESEPAPSREEPASEGTYNQTPATRLETSPETEDGTQSAAMPVGEPTEPQDPAHKSPFERLIDAVLSPIRQVLGWL